jgi:hypothetical protein
MPVCNTDCSHRINARSPFERKERQIRKKASWPTLTDIIKNSVGIVCRANRFILNESGLCL